jgi:hypothetical protein
MAPEKAHRGEFLEVIKGVLHVGKELTAFQLLLKEWFYTCLTFGTIFFFGLQLSVLFCVQWCMECRRAQQERIILDDDASENLDFEGMTTGGDSGDRTDDQNRNNNIHEDVDGSQSLNDERRFSEGVYNDNAEYDDGHDGEWEDLPPQSSGRVHVTDSNDDIRDPGGITWDMNPQREPPQSEEANDAYIHGPTSSAIPDDNSLPPTDSNTGHNHTIPPED